MNDVIILLFSVVSPNQSIQQSQPQHQQQQIVILSNPEQNQPQFIQQHIQEPSPPQRINNKKPKYVKGNRKWPEV